MGKGLRIDYTLQRGKFSMLVSSVGHFNRNINNNYGIESNKAQTAPVVTKGLTFQEQEDLKNISLYQNIKQTAGILFNMFSDTSKDMKRSLDMIA